MKNALFVLFIFLSTVEVNAEQIWSIQNSPFSEQLLGKIQFTSRSEGWITVGNGMFLHTTNGGVEWDFIEISDSDNVEIISDPAVGMSFINETTGWVIGTLGGLQNSDGAVLYKTIDGGQSWMKIELSPWTIGFAVMFIDESNGWATVFDDSIKNDVLEITDAALLKTTDGGSTWITLSDVTGVPFFTDVNTGWMVSSSLSANGEIIPPHEILHTTNGGLSWISQLRDDSLVDTRIYFTDANNGWIVSDLVILHTVNGGANWIPVNNTGVIQSQDTKNVVFFLNTNVGWIGSHYHPDGTNPNTALFHTTDGGITWVQESLPVNDKIFSMYFVDENTGWLVFDDGKIAHTASDTPVSVKESLFSEFPLPFTIEQNYPNPFNPTTTINFSLANAGNIMVEVYNVAGQKVDTIVNEYMESGSHSAVWDATEFSASVYFCTVKNQGHSKTIKITLVK